MFFLEALICDIFFLWLLLVFTLSGCLFKHSPFFGSGFHADRIMLDFAHMHNSYFHSLVQSGAIGTFFFAGAIIGIWHFIFKNNLLRRVKEVRENDQAFITESILIVTFLTARSFFESTAAFYGVDLLIFVPAIAYIFLWTQKNLEVRDSEMNSEKSGS